MKKIVILLLLSFLLYGADKLDWLGRPKGVLERAFSFRIVLPVSQGDPLELQKLREENLELLSKITDQKNLISENQALRIQLGAPRQRQGQKFLPAKVLGGNSNLLIIDKGKASDLQVNQTVVYKNTLVGRVVSLSENRSRVELVTSEESKIPAKTEKGALGIVNANQGTLILDNVTLSEKLEVKDLVFTAGSIDGFIPDLLIGEVKKVFKSESALFQQAEIESPLDFKRLEMVFLVI